MTITWKTWGEVVHNGWNECDFDESHHEALIKELVFEKLVICGDTHQIMAIPMFEDGYLMLSMRRWAEIMAEAYACLHGCKQGDMLPPMAFYMSSTCPIEENWPWEIDQ